MLFYFLLSLVVTAWLANIELEMTCTILKRDVNNKNDDDVTKTRGNLLKRFLTDPLKPNHKKEF